MKRFLTVFPAAKNIHLLKDVGMIPYVLHRELKYESTLLCYKNGEYPYVHQEVEGLKIVFLKKIFHHPLLDVLHFLLFNGHKYDVVQVYHLRRISLLMAYCCKVISLGRCKTYLKLDADEHIMHYKPSKIVNYLLKYVNLISVESKTYQTYLNQYQTLGKEVCYIPNGFYDEGCLTEIDVGQKENIILTVGRIGTHQKATEVLCNGFKKFAAAHSDWVLQIVGPIEDLFKPFIATYFEENPWLKERVIFKGPIQNRTELDQYYRKAKIFLLSSRYEGFPMVLTEAAKFGCYIIATDLPAAREIINEGKYGSVFPVNNEQALAEQLHKVSNTPAQLDSLAPAIQSFAYRKYYWPTICKTINDMLC